MNNVFFIVFNQFSKVLESNGVEFMKYKTDLELTLQAALSLDGKKCYQYTSVALMQFLRSLVTIYPLENRISEADFDDPNYLAIKVNLDFDLLVN